MKIISIIPFINLTRENRLNHLKLSLILLPSDKFNNYHLSNVDQFVDSLNYNPRLLAVPPHFRDRIIVGLKTCQRWRAGPDVIVRRPVARPIITLLDVDIRFLNRGAWRVAGSAEIRYRRSTVYLQ